MKRVLTVSLVLALGWVCAAAGAATDAGWLAKVSHDIEAGEYHFSPGSDGVVWTAPNRAHDLRARWLDDGSLALEPRPAPGTWTLRYRVRTLGRGASMATVGPLLGEQAVDGRLERSRVGLEEWYVNDARGLEFGFTVHSRPGGPEDQPLIVESELGGLLAYPTADGQGILLRTDGGVDAMRIAGLKVTDARGVALTACLDVGLGTLGILVDDHDAVYPVTIDPLMTSPAWTAESDQRGADFGISSATAGDVNGDGYADVIVGATLYDNGENDEGRAFVYHGSATGLATAPAWTAESNQADTLFGESVATAGDVNGDGFADVIVGAIYYSNGESHEGGAFVYLGSATGLLTAPAWTAESNQADANFGQSVATAGDVNRDGFSDVIVGADIYTNGETFEGRAVAYHGSSTGLATTPAWSAEGNQAFAGFGWSVATAGDVNGDGFSDVLIGAWQYDNGESNEGRAFLFRGSATGLATTPAWTAEGNQMRAAFAVSVATAGDINGDGYADVIVGAYNYSNVEMSEGRAFVYRGSSSGLATTPTWTTEGNQVGANFGWSVATAGDVNGDGFADVIVGASLYDNGELDEGRAAVYLGSATGLAATPVWTGESDQASADYGWSVATAGDVDGDGYSDMVVGAYLYSNGQNGEGRAFVYHGSASGLATSAWTAESDQGAARFGWSVATAGDVNGDGYSDVVIGAGGYDNGQAEEGRAFLHYGSASGLITAPAWTAESNQDSVYFGDTVSAAGDVNGDGYSDVIIGASLYDNGEIDEGRAFVYLGSASGLANTAAWTAESDQAAAYLGTSVATAGDVNGDGYSDVIVGAYAYDNGEPDEGRALLYLGSALGLGTTPAWSAESNQANALFGNSVATAGDVNSDGYSDAIVGANAYDNGEDEEGRAFVYLGSATGLSATSDWTAEGDQFRGFFSTSVATAGDVNGDGYSDVIVGSNLFDNGENDEGRAFVFHGSATGLGSTAAWTAESDQAMTVFGWSVATAGDVNGDGYSDVIVGAPLYDTTEFDAGRVFVYLGSAFGLGTTPAWTAEARQLRAAFGDSVGTAGDVNGDGYSDVIIGARYYDNGEMDEGRAFLYYGNDGDGLDRIPRQARADASAPIDLLGRTKSGNFRLRANGRTPFGRDQVRLEWEVKPLSTPFDGIGIKRSNWFDTRAPGASGSVVPLEESDGPLTIAGPYKWRLRLRSRFPFPWQSHWMSLPYNNQTETDLQFTPCALSRMNRVSPLIGLKAPADAALFSWPEDSWANDYHLNYVNTKLDLLDPRSTAPGTGTIDCATTLLNCVTTVYAAPGVRFYQLLPACDVASEGPW